MDLRSPEGTSALGAFALALQIGLAMVATPTLAGSESWLESAKLLASDGSAGEKFGFSAALSDELAVVGAHRSDRTMGAAYVFARVGRSFWVEQAKLEAAEGEVGDFFGGSVALFGDSVLVGALADDENGFNAGAAYVFVGADGEWTEQAKLLPSDPGENDLFGVSVAFSGDTALVGAYQDDDNGPNSGAAYIFVGSNERWVEEAKLTPSEGEDFENFGFSVALSGNTALVGAFGNGESGNHSGAAYVFVRSNGTWTEQAQLLPSPGAEGDVFGVSVALLGDTALVGAAGDDEGEFDAGAAYIFQRSGDVWTQEAKLVSSDAEFDDRFGTSVALSSEAALVGAEWDDDDGTRSGSAYVFERSGVFWVERAKLRASGGAALDYFGGAVALSDQHALIGAVADDDNGNVSGSAYVFRRAVGVFEDGFESGSTSAWSVVVP